MTRRADDRGERAAVEVADVVEQMAARLRGFGSRQWREPVPPDGRQLADVVHELVEWCARREAELRGITSGRDVVPDRPPYDAALADQLAVVGHDLADAVARDDRAAGEVLRALRDSADRLRLKVD